MNETREYKTSPQRRATNKRHYMKMLKEGRCVDCGKADELTQQGRSRCAVCNEKHKRPVKKTMTQERRDMENANKREWSRMLRTLNLCVDCGRKDGRTLDGKCRCRECANKRAVRRKETWDYEHEKELRDARKQRRIEAGLCTECGGEKEEPDKKMCINCQVRWKMRKERMKLNHGWLPRGANGKCYQCNRAQAIEGKRLCQECYDKKIAILRENGKKRWVNQHHEENTHAGGY